MDILLQIHKNTENTDIYELEIVISLCTLHNNLLHKNLENCFQTASNHHEHYT